MENGGKAPWESLIYTEKKVELTAKGVAYAAALITGLIHEGDDINTFNEFWDEFESAMAIRSGSSDSPKREYMYSSDPMWMIWLIVSIIGVVMVVISIIVILRKLL